LRRSKLSQSLTLHLLGYKLKNIHSWTIRICGFQQTIQQSPRRTQSRLVIIQLQMCHCNLALKLPLSTAHGAEGCRCLRIDPLQYAVKMISMVAGTPDERAVITRELTVRAAAVKSHPAYATCLILCIPRPRSYRMPLKNLNFHCATWYAKSKA
jgi:hypothetical protein